MQGDSTREDLRKPGAARYFKFCPGVPTDRIGIDEDCCQLLFCSKGQRQIDGCKCLPFARLRTGYHDRARGAMLFVYLPAGYHVLFDDPEFLACLSRPRPGHDDAALGQSHRIEGASTGERSRDTRSILKTIA